MSANASPSSRSLEAGSPPLPADRRPGAGVARFEPVGEERAAVAGARLREARVLVDSVFAAHPEVVGSDAGYTSDGASLGAAAAAWVGVAFTSGPPEPLRWGQ